MVGLVFVDHAYSAVLRMKEEEKVWMAASST